jgi:hypothetical protein
MRSRHIWAAGLVFAGVAPGFAAFRVVPPFFPSSPSSPRCRSALHGDAAGMPLFIVW